MQTQTAERHYNLDYHYRIETVLVGFELEHQQFDQRPSTEIRQTAALYAQHQLAFFTYGARVDTNSRFGVAVSPRASIAHAFGDFRLRGSAGVGIKEPTFFENYGGFGIAGNPDLDPERSLSWDAGVDAYGISVTFFHNHFDDMIAFTGNGFANIQEAETYGIEASASRAFDVVTIGLSYMWLHTSVLDDGGIAQTAFVEGRPLLRRPEHSGAAWAELCIDRFEFKVTTIVVGPRVDRDFGQFPEPRIRNPGYVRVDIAASFVVIEEVKLRLQIQNLLDHRYQEAFGFRSPGFWLMAGLEVTP
jgi:outer membrane cobalamin receptor